MELIDDEGDLFGYVNVVDAIAVLLVIAVAVAGLAVIGVFGEESGDPATRYATIDLGEQPEYVAERIDAGDSVSFAESNESLTITDVHVSASDGGVNDSDANVVVRTRVRGTLAEHQQREAPVFTYAGDRFRLGRTLSIDTTEYTVDGAVTRIGESNARLNANATPVVLETTVSEATAEAVSVGDEYRIAGRTVGTVETVHSYPIDGQTRRVQVGLSLSTIDRNGRTAFAGRSLRTGATLGFAADGYELDGEVLRTDATAPAGERTTTRIEVELESVSAERADSLTTGMQETVRGETLATVRSVSEEPATVVLESDDGQIYEREHPTKRDVTMTVDLTTYRTTTGLRFHGMALRQNSSITLDFGNVLVGSTVTDVDAA